MDCDYGYVDDYWTATSSGGFLHPGRRQCAVQGARQVLDSSTYFCHHHYESGWSHLGRCTYCGTPCKAVSKHFEAGVCPGCRATRRKSVGLYCVLNRKAKPSTVKCRYCSKDVYRTACPRNDLHTMSAACYECAQFYFCMRRPDICHNGVCREVDDFRLQKSSYWWKQTRGMSDDQIKTFAVAKYLLHLVKEKQGRKCGKSKSG